MKKTAGLGTFWKKREIVTYGLSILVFMIHISSFGNYQNSAGGYE